MSPSPTPDPAGETLEKWRDPYGDYHRDFPADLAQRLEELPAEVATEFKDREIAGRVFYERFHVLLAVMHARDLNAASFDLDEPPSYAEKTFGMVIGQAFHQGCSLADVALFAGLPPDRVIAIGQRTIKRKKWLERL